MNMQRHRLLLIALAVLSLPVHAGDPVVTDTRVISEERRLTLLEARLSALRLEVERLEDRRAIERLQQSYTHYVTAGRPHEAATLFSSSPEASIEFAQMGVYVGRARIEAFLGRVAKAAPGVLNWVPTMQGVIHVAADGQSAQGRWRSLVMAGVHGQDGQWIEGPYENDYVKDNGVWKIKRLHWYTTVAASYDLGWNRGALPIAGPLPDLPPDRPPSVAYQAYPSFFVPPYHYAHPVTGKSVGWDP
jgi:SnoaL-like domain